MLKAMDSIKSDKSLMAKYFPKKKKKSQKVSPFGKIGQESWLVWYLIWVQIIWIVAKTKLCLELKLDKFSRTI